VLVSTPIDLARAIQLDKPSLRVSYETEDLTRPRLEDVLKEFTTQRRGVAHEEVHA
jgi:predicted GTPase